MGYTIGGRRGFRRSWVRLMSWLYVDTAKFRKFLEDRRDLLANPRIRRMRGGSFGGGGASGEWDRSASAGRAKPAQEPYWVPIVTGDADCPESGVKRAWRYAIMNDVDGIQRVWGPHDDGPFTLFYGYNIRRQYHPAVGGGLPYDEWLKVDNAVVLEGGNLQGFPAGKTPNCATAGTGICNLPSPNLAGPTDIYAERHSMPVKESTSGGTDYYRVNVGALWQSGLVACTPPRTIYVPVGSDALDRKRVPNSETEKVSEDDEGFLPPFIVPPPFVFGVIPGAPIGRPPISEGGFRGRKPPRSRTRESKKRGPLRTILRIADIVSESAEVVDCFYGTLPKKTRRAWEKGRPNRGLLDEAGQYGIDGADWKGQALWHNHKNIDWVEGLQCVAYNQFIEDALVGRLQAKLPKGAGTAVGRLVKQDKYRRERERQNAKWARIRRENASRVAAARRRRAA